MSMDGLNNFANSLNSSAGSINNVATGVGNVTAGVANVQGAMINVGVAAGAYSYPAQPYYQADAYSPGQTTGGPAIPMAFITVAGGLANGGLNAYRNAATVAGSMKGMFGGGKAAAAAVQGAEGAAVAGAARVGLGKALFRGTPLSAAIGGGLSLITNGIEFMKGRITKGQFAGNVVADTGGAVIGGIGAAAAGGLAAMVFGGGMIIPVIAGALGFAGINLIYELTGARQAISTTISGMFGG